MPTGSLLWTLYHPLAFTVGPGGLSSALRSYPFAIGLALVVLAWAERNGALLALALGYSAVVLVTATFGPAGLAFHAAQSDSRPSGSAAATATAPRARP